VKKIVFLVTGTDLVEYRFLSLLDRDCELVISSSKKDALSKLSYKNNKVDLIILDLGISEEVFSLIKEIKDRRITKPIILLSNQSDKKYFIRAVKLGIDDYIIKPFEDKRMEMTLQKYLDSENPPIRNEVSNYQRDLLLEIKKAKKGDYPVTFLTFRFIGNNKLLATNLFAKKISSKLWDTDQVLFYSKHTLIGIFLFSGMESINLIEEKMRYFYFEVTEGRNIFDETDMLIHKKVFPFEFSNYDELIYEIDTFAKE